jgi:hypothetical protein
VKHLLVVVLVAAALSCTSQEQTAAAERIKADERSRAVLETDPSPVLMASGWQTERESSDSTRATTVTWTNRTTLAVTGLEGQFAYLDGNGAAMSTVPFKAEGEIGPGETKTLKIYVDAVAGIPMGMHVHVEKVQILLRR